jgi:diguanylate cyclase (GGDEF)-like protein
MAFLRRAKKRDDVIVDRVTGAFNRRQLDADVAAGLDTSDQPTATLLISVDDFPSFTGKKGVVSGDQVLERVSWVIMATVRTTDVVYRHTRDSFCVLLPATTDADALAAADRIRGNVERMPLLAESRVTVSVGVATGAGSDLASTIQRADDALASGSSSGANQVFVERRSTDRAFAAPSMATAPTASPAPAPAPPTATSPAPAEMAPPASAPFAPPSI